MQQSNRREFLQSIPPNDPLLILSLILAHSVQHRGMTNINRFQCNRQSIAKVKFALPRERWYRNDHRFVAGTRQLEKTIYELVIFSYISIDSSRFLVSYVTFVPPEYTQF